MSHDRDNIIRDLVNEQYDVDLVEVDNGATVSEGEGGEIGAFVQAWVWVSFSGTELDDIGEE